MCALKKGRSAESTMGFTALDGLPMGTRPGQIDPGVVLYLIAEKGMSASDAQNFLYRDCGLKGLSGVSNDMRELAASEDPKAKLAIAYFVYRIGLNAGMLAAALQGLDAFEQQLLVDQVRPLQRRAECGPELWLERRHAVVAVFPGTIGLALRCSTPSSMEAADSPTTNGKSLAALARPL